MTLTELLAILAMTGYAIYRQTRVNTVTGHSRFKLAMIYGAIGLAVGGFAAPHGATAVGVLVGGALLSVLVGLVRGRLTRMWMTEDGAIHSQGTPVTVLLFLALIASKFAVGSIAYIEHVHDGGGFGEIMVMIAVMVAIQAEIIWRRAQVMHTKVASIQLPV